MIIIIEGKKYNTETAKMIACYNNMDGIRILQRDDARFFETALYRKKTGEYFICTEGNCMSDEVNSIDPVSEEGAKRWSEIYLSVHKYEELWGEVEE